MCKSTNPEPKCNHLLYLTVTPHANVDSALTHPRARYQVTRDQPCSPELPHYSNFPILSLLIISILPCPLFPTKSPTTALGRAPLSSISASCQPWCFPVWPCVGAPHLLCLGICEEKLLPLWQSFSHLCVLSWWASHSVMTNSLLSHGLYSPRNSPGQNTGVGSLSLFQGNFPTQGSNPDLPHCRQIFYQLSHKGRPLRWWWWWFSH